MNDFDKLHKECIYYKDNYFQDDLLAQVEFCMDVDFDFSALTWGYTPFKTFQQVISNIKKPKRLIVFGCSTGYQCFFWNHLFPDVPVIGIDVLAFRLNWGADVVDKYKIDNVTLLQGNFLDFQIEDGDLIWENNLLFDDETMIDYNKFLLSNFDIQIISYVSIPFDDNFLIDINSNPIKISHIHQLLETSWTSDQDFYYYYKEKDFKVEFGTDFILPEYRVSDSLITDYDNMLLSKKDIESEKLKILFNKQNLKNLFRQIGFNVPETYNYSNCKTNIEDVLKKYNTFVAKPAHRSECVGVYINDGSVKVNYKKISDDLNKQLDKSDYEYFKRSKIDGGVFWKDCERGIIVEQFIDVKYEFKVFVVWGTPIVGDLRKSSSEYSRVDFVKLNNKYLKWESEYELIKKLSKELKIDFFRIDFLYDGEKLWASELAIMPGTELPEDIKDVIYKNWSREYLKFYYPNLVL